MSNMRYASPKKSGKGGKGFFVALGVCQMCIRDRNNAAHSFPKPIPLSISNDLSMKRAYCRLPMSTLSKVKPHK